MDNLPLVKIGEDATQKAVMHNAPRKNLTIAVLGETSRADNFSLGGYSRDTNPLMRQDGVIYFPHTTSCGTATAVSVPCMFSNMPRAHYDEELAHHQEGVTDILQRAGIRVLWNDNDGGCKGACDRVPHQNVTDLKLTGQCIDGECYDDVLFHNLDSYIDNLQQDGIIVLHTIGSHGPTYYNRYPAAFRKFTPTCDTNEIRGCTREQLTNTYDNTILYVDYVVDKAIKLLQSKQDKFTTSPGLFVRPRRIAGRRWRLFAWSTVFHRAGYAETCADGAVALRRLPAALRHFRALSAAAGAKRELLAG